MGRRYQEVIGRAVEVVAQKDQSERDAHSECVSRACYGFKDEINLHLKNLNADRLDILSKFCKEFGVFLTITENREDSYLLEKDGTKSSGIKVRLNHGLQF